ncbi:hypothetical protein GGTG_13448 [Gaeumannomyces tritici R3-111a-1]|uniref:Uncharacterized protein n=1 Tax=Gaeumannomyces tritici (strain R3-111a-1) TaxID=644352 RepID=J3PIW8_GAET3|nr:hypothetical protein GGTG_13448 [Gaeumannomyces tritici R3-111a-1]EJT69051.1 hypothetical protein GGTG_13448 [Gaeumannomyces tritici R3-111a-1]
MLRAVRSGGAGASFASANQDASLQAALSRRPLVAAHELNKLEALINKSTRGRSGPVYQQTPIIRTSGRGCCKEGVPVRARSAALTNDGLVHMSSINGISSSSVSASRLVLCAGSGRH